MMPVCFLRKNLELEKYKHTYVNNKLFGKDKQYAASFNKFEFAHDKVEFKDSQTRKSLTFVQGNAIYADKYFKKDLFHIIVG